MERHLLLYRTRTEFDLEYRVTFNGAKTWSEAEYVIKNIEHPIANDAIVWGNYEVVIDDPKVVWNTQRTTEGPVANFPPSASYPTRNQQTALAAMRQMGAVSEALRLRVYLLGVMGSIQYPDGWRPDYMDFMNGLTPMEKSYDDVWQAPGETQLRSTAWDFYLMSDKAWYQVEYHNNVPSGAGSYPYRDRTANPLSSAIYREVIWPHSRAFRLKSAIDLLWRFGEERLTNAYDMLVNDGGWDGHGPAKNLVGAIGNVSGGSSAYKGYWLGAFAMCANIIWRYASFVGNASIKNAVEILCHDSAERILDLRVPNSGIYTEIVRTVSGAVRVERMHPDIVGWLFDAYDYDEDTEAYLPKAWAPPIAVVGEWMSETFGAAKPNQPDWVYGPNVSYESMIMMWQALNMYIANFN